MKLMIEGGREHHSFSSPLTIPASTGNQTRNLWVTSRLDQYCPSNCQVNSTEGLDLTKAIFTNLITKPR